MNKIKNFLLAALLVLAGGSGCSVSGVKAETRKIATLIKEAVEDPDAVSKKLKTQLEEYDADATTTITDYWIEKVIKPIKGQELALIVLIRNNPEKAKSGMYMALPVTSTQFKAQGEISVGPDYSTIDDWEELGLFFSSLFWAYHDAKVINGDYMNVLSEDESKAFLPEGEETVETLTSGLIHVYYNPDVVSKEDIADAKAQLEEEQEGEGEEAIKITAKFYKL
jgi:hypothetical protein